MHNQETETPSGDHAILSGWQEIVDIMAEICGVPAGLIMRVTGPEIEVFVANQASRNPYHVGDHERMVGSGLYCEHVVRTRSPLHIPDARIDEKWCNNPDIELDMIAYHGYPILLPSGEVFGTICILDQKPFDLGPLHNRLMRTLKAHIEQDLCSAAAVEELQKRNDELTGALAMVKTLEGILPTCARCRKIRIHGADEVDPKSWIQLEAYVQSHTNAQFSHTEYPDCFRQNHGEVAWRAYLEELDEIRE